MECNVLTTSVMVVVVVFGCVFQMSAFSFCMGSEVFGE